MNKPQSNLTGIRFKPDIEKWEARISLKNKSHSQTFKKLEDAIEWRKKREDQKFSPSFFLCPEIFPQWLESLKQDRDISPQTHMKYFSDTKVHLTPFFKGIALKNIDDAMALKFAIQLKETKYCGRTLSTKTIKNIVGALSNFFEYCCLREYMELNPAKSPLFKQNLTRLVKERRRSEQNIKEKSRNGDELNKLLIASYQRSYDFGLTVELMLSSGLRLGEVAALTWGDLQRSLNSNADGYLWFVSVNKTRYFKDKRIQHAAKSGSNGFVPLPVTLIERLEEWKKQSVELGYSIHPEDVIFPKIAQNQMGFSRMIASTSRQLGIRKTTAHCLRHSYVTYLATHGHDLQQVQKAARHSSVNMTRAYFSASQLGMENIAKTMESILIPSCHLG